MIYLCLTDCSSVGGVGCQEGNGRCCHGKDFFALISLPEDLEIRFDNPSGALPFGCVFLYSTSPIHSVFFSTYEVKFTVRRVKIHSPRMQGITEDN